MSRLNPPPTYENVVGGDGKASLPYILFFNQVYEGDTGTTWAPTFVNLTEVGTPTITGRYYRLTQRLVYFAVTIVPQTSTTATAGTTYISNFPLTLQGDGACLAVTGLTGSNAGMCEATTNRIYVPGWTAITVPLTIVGLVEAR